MVRHSLQRIARAAAFAAALLPPYSQAATLQIQLTDSRNRNAEGVGVVVETSSPEALPAAPPKAVMDQRREQFVPRMLIVQRGTQVAFPNTDRVQHHVYSFSQAKQFELALYRGNEHPPVTFDRDGVAVLGCNIHDHMVGYVLVVDSSHFGLTDHDGRLVLSGLPNEAVKVTLWHPDLGVEYGEINRTVDLTSGNSAAVIQLDRAWQVKQEASLSWNDY
jgi:plastocyanin